MKTYMPCMNLWSNFFHCLAGFFFQWKDQLVQRLTIQLLPLIKAVINFSSLYVNLTHGMLYISGVKCTKKKNHINYPIVFFFTQSLINDQFRGSNWGILVFQRFSRRFIELFQTPKFLGTLLYYSRVQNST